MKYLPLRYLVVLWPLLATTDVVRAQAPGDLAFTAFGNPDPATLDGGKVLQQKGGLIEFQRGITAQSLYVINAAPADVEAKLANWTPATHPALQVWAHVPLPLHPTAADFTMLASLPGNSSVRNLVTATQNGDPSLQLNKNEMQMLQSMKAQGGDRTALFANFWSQVMSGRAVRFLGGFGADDDYEINGGNIAPLGDIKSLLRSDVKIYQAFHPLLAQTPLYKPTKPPVNVYTECFDVEGTAALGTGALYQDAAPDGALESVDLEFYVCSGIYCSVELEKIWPVTINGRNESLVWRDDLVSTSSIAYLHGTERMASGLIMLQDVKTAIDAFRSEFR